MRYHYKYIIFHKKELLLRGNSGQLWIIADLFCAQFCGLRPRLLEIFILSHICLRKNDNWIKKLESRKTWSISQHNKVISKELNKFIVSLGHRNSRLTSATVQFFISIPNNLHIAPRSHKAHHMSPKNSNQDGLSCSRRNHRTDNPIQWK